MKGRIRWELEFGFELILKSAELWWKGVVQWIMMRARRDEADGDDVDDIYDEDDEEDDDESAGET